MPIQAIMAAGHLTTLAQLVVEEDAGGSGIE
jgi:hypothetical protein